MKKTTSTLEPTAPPARPGGRHPGSVPDRVLTALRASSGPVRPVELAKQLDLPSGSVANALRNLTIRGEAERIRSKTVVNGPGASQYIASDSDSVPAQTSG